MVDAVDLKLTSERSAGSSPAPGTNQLDRKSDIAPSISHHKPPQARYSYIAAFAGAWFVLPYRVDATEKSAAEFAGRVERRFEATEAEQRRQR